MAADIISLLGAALSSPDGSQQQGIALASMSDAFSRSPQAVSTVYKPLIDNIQSRPPVLKDWIVSELLEPTLARHLVPPDMRLQLAQQSLVCLATLWNGPDLRLRRQSVVCFTSVYPILFRHVCQNNDQSLWNRILELKNGILASWKLDNSNVAVVGTKLIQRIIQTQTRASADPRMQNKGEPNLSNCPSHHSFLQATTLETEANKLLEDCVKALYISQNADLISAIISTFGFLLKARPAFSQLIVTSLVTWDPTSALPKGTTLQVRSVEKNLRITLAYLLRTGSAGQFMAQINGFLHAQNSRMQKAAEQAARKREEEASRKRSQIAEVVEQQHVAKRRKLSGPQTSFADAAAHYAQTDTTTDAAASFDVTQLPIGVVIELIVANLQAVPQPRLDAALNSIRGSLGLSAGIKQEEASNGPINPLEMDDESDDDLDALQADTEEEPGKTVTTAAAQPTEGLETFELPPPDKYPPDVERRILTESVRRICLNGARAVAMAQGQDHLWLSLLSRLITRGLDGEADEVRAALFDFVEQKPNERVGLARMWLNEEWFGGRKNGQIKKEESTDAVVEPKEGSVADDAEAQASQSPYRAWLSRLLDLFVSKMDKEGYKAFAQFIVDLPYITRQEYLVLKTMCESADPSKLQAGITALRDIAQMRPGGRQDALDMLLALATHSNRTTRNAAIITIRKWVPDQKALSESVCKFAALLLTHLEDKPAANGVNGTAEDADMEEGESKDEDKTKITCADVVAGDIVGGLPEPIGETSVAQHLDLLLGASINNADLLDDLFRSYPKMKPDVQALVQTQVLPPIRRLGAANPKIISLVEQFPEGCESLILRMLGALSEKGKMAEELVKLVKSIVMERDLGARFIIPVIGELEKSEIQKRLPRIVSLLNNTPEERELIKNVFQSVTISQEAAFGSLSTNVPRVRQSELLTPVELLVLLHMNEKEIGLKQNIEAINICFSLPDVFRPDAFAAFMQQVVDEPDLPTLFLRTVIQAVTTYKSLQQYVSSTLLTRLVLRKIWTTPQLWEGFIRCSKQIAPHSFGALVMLPKEQLREVVVKQPALRPSLREYVQQTRGLNQARRTALLESLD